MKEKGNESSSSSLVIVSKKMLMAGIAGTALFSFGLGYFFGYGGTTSNRMVKQVEADNRVAPSEERTVLDSSGKPTIVPPPATPGVIPKEPPLVVKRTEESVIAPKLTGEEPKSIEEKKPDTVKPLEKKPADSVGEKIADNDNKPDAKAASGKGKDTGAGKKSGKETVAKDKKKQAMPAGKKKVNKQASGKTGHFYAVQLGAFSDPGKAKCLKDELAKKGYKADITSYSPAGKALSRVRIGHYTTKREAEELASSLKSQGIESVVVYGSR